MKHETKLGIGLSAFIAAALGWSAITDEPAEPTAQQRVAAAQAQTRARLTQLAPARRRDIDYAALDARFKRMVAKPNMVGMAVGVVEQGRITFLSGYGETLAGSGEAVTPETVFRWASVSKGVASTMVAKLAEQGKFSLDQPVAPLAPSLQLPNGAQTTASVADVLSHRLGPLSQRLRQQAGGRAERVDAAAAIVHAQRIVRAGDVLVIPEHRL